MKCLLRVFVFAYAFEHILGFNVFVTDPAIPF